MLEKARKVFPLEPPEGTSPDNNLTSAQGDSLWKSDFLFFFFSRDLHTQLSMKPDTGLKLTTMRSRLEGKSRVRQQ